MLKSNMMNKRIKNIIGTGGIGKGQFFLFHTEKALGRNESRMARLSDARDYCKLHIVFHYLSILLSREVEIVPIGMVGNDASGYELRDMMARAGMNVEWVTMSENKPTMLSICFQYPDKSGGNITSDNSACMEVDADYIRNAMDQMDIGERSIAMALPEVSMEARMELLRNAKKKGAYCVASCGAEEVHEFIVEGGPDLCDLIALNQDEAAAFAEVKMVSGREGVLCAAKRILEQYPHLTLWITCGAEGSLLIKQNRHAYYESLKGIHVENTGGAGDASLAGLISGLCCGMPLFAQMNAGDEEPAGMLAVRMAGLSVESANSINDKIDWEYLRKREQNTSVIWSE